jgi:outer membrane biosynthesis protein TonB
LKNIENHLRDETEVVRSKFLKGCFNAEVEFIIEVDRSLKHEKIIYSSGNESIDQEMLKIIAQMQNWQAENQRKIPVRVQYTLPVVFE